MLIRLYWHEACNRIGDIMNYQHKAKSPCKYCGKMINVSRHNIHYKYCKERVYKLSINQLTIGEASEAGRLDEFKAYIDKLEREGNKI
jgi:endogenous inhibitor of DNA gyrase (YacG/DUF329 family)